MTPAQLRRAFAARPDADLGGLELDVAALAAPLDAGALRELLAGYLLDPDGGTISDARADVAQWFDSSPLAIRRAPGGGGPRSDALAAVIAAPALIGDDGLLASTWARRAAPRADDAIGAALALLSAPHALSAIGRLAGEPLPDEEVLHLALLQAGRALAWSAPRLADAAPAAALVDRLLGLLVRGSAAPVLGRAVAALGPVAATATPLGARIRERALALLDEQMALIEPPRQQGSFLAEFERLHRGHQDEEWYRLLPHRRLAEHAAQLCGRGAHLGDARALRARVTERWQEGESLAAAFGTGVAASGDAVTVTALVGDLLGRGDDAGVELALSVASNVPADGCIDTLLALARSRDPARRMLAVPAVALLAEEIAVPALAAALDDEDGEVCAVAAVLLRDHGRTDLLAARRLAGDRRLHAAVVRAAIPDHDHAVLTTLVAAIAEGLDEADALGRSDEDGAAEAAASLVDAIGESALTGVLGDALRGSTTGVERTTQLLRELPDALPVVALAIGSDPPEVALPAALAGPLGAALDAIVAEQPDAEVIALALRGHFGRGDPALADRALAFLRARPDHAADLLAVLAAIGVRSAAAGDAIAPLVAQAHDLPLRGAAAASAGAIAPVDHPLWASVRELLGLGTILGDAAHDALVHRAREQAR